MVILLNTRGTACQTFGLSCTWLKSWCSEGLLQERLYVKILHQWISTSVPKQTNKKQKQKWNKNISLKLRCQSNIDNWFNVNFLTINNEWTFDLMWTLLLAWLFRKRISLSFPNIFLSQMLWEKIIHLKDEKIY